MRDRDYHANGARGYAKTSGKPAERGEGDGQNVLSRPRRRDVKRTFRPGKRDRSREMANDFLKACKWNGSRYPSPLSAARLNPRGYDYEGGGERPVISIIKVVVIKKRKKGGERPDSDLAIIRKWAPE